MQMISEQQAEHEAQRMRANRAELVERIARVMRHDGAIEPLPGLFLHRLSAPKGPLHSVTKASFCVIAQGCKVILLGDARYQYDPFHYLLATLDLPSVSQVLEASQEQPYLSLRLELPASVVSVVMDEIDFAAPASASDSRAINVSGLDANLLDATVRLVRLLDDAEEARILMPLVTREIIYRLLLGDQGTRLRHLTLQTGYNHEIARAVERLRHDFAQPLRIEQIAHELGMSVSGFHHRFKTVTAMSPLQFQKRLRLQEARRLLLSENLDAASAAYRVGYNDASHFNREYKSLFGVPPMRDMQRLREAAVGSSAD